MPDTLTHGPGACAAAVTTRTRAIVPVHLYGQPADMDGDSRRSPSRHALAIVEDCCQAHLATGGGDRRSARVGRRRAFSFYPTKNLGALGDGGAVDHQRCGARRSRSGGCATAARPNAVHHVEAGVNSRLDELQAAVLRARLPLLAGVDRPAPRAGRRAIASTLPASLRTIRRARPRARLPPVSRSLATERDALQAHLAAAGIETLIHYPVPLTQQPAFAAIRPRGVSRSPRAPRGELLSLPLSSAAAGRRTSCACRRQPWRPFAKGHRPA